MQHLKLKELPKLDDEFAKDVSEFDTLKELKEDIKEKKQKQYNERAKYEIEDNAMKQVVESMKIDIPSGMIELEIDNMLKDMEQRLSYQGMNFDQYLQMMGKTKEDARKEYEPQAIDAIKSRMAIEKVAELENIDASEEEIHEKLEEMAKNYGRDVKEFEGNENIKNYIATGVKTEKALEFIVDNAKIKPAKKEKKEDKKEEKKTTKSEKAKK